MGWHLGKAGDCFDSDLAMVRRLRIDQDEPPFSAIAAALREIDRRGPGRLIVNRAWHDSPWSKEPHQ